MRITQNQYAVFGSLNFMSDLPYLSVRCKGLGVGLFPGWPYGTDRNSVPVETGAVYHYFQMKKPAPKRGLFRRKYFQKNSATPELNFLSARRTGKPRQL
jgi:hypothetical protein